MREQRMSTVSFFSAYCCSPDRPWYNWARTLRKEQEKPRCWVDTQYQQQQHWHQQPIRSRGAFSKILFKCFFYQLNRLTESMLWRYSKPTLIILFISLIQLCFQFCFKAKREAFFTHSVLLSLSGAAITNYAVCNFLWNYLCFQLHRTYHDIITGNVVVTCYLWPPAYRDDMSRRFSHL